MLSILTPNILIHTTLYGLGRRACVFRVCWRVKAFHSQHNYTVYAILFCFLNGKVWTCFKVHFVVTLLGFRALAQMQFKVNTY